MKRHRSRRLLRLRLMTAVPTGKKKQERHR